MHECTVTLTEELLKFGRLLEEWEREQDVSRKKAQPPDAEISPSTSIQPHDASSGIAITRGPESADAVGTSSSRSPSCWDGLFKCFRS